MHTFPLLCSLLLCNGVMVSVQKKIQKLPDEEKESPAQIQTLQTLSRGWGDDIEWVQTYEEGLAQLKHSKKPLMVIHHLEECPYSQAFRKAFAASPEIQQVAQEDFIMLNLVHSSSDDNMVPDGHYVPRILFVVRADLTGKYGNRTYTYEPEDISTYLGIFPIILSSFSAFSAMIENMRQVKLLLHTEL